MKIELENYTEIYMRYGRVDAASIRWPTQVVIVHCAVCSVHIV